MPRRTALAAASGLVAGVAITATLTDGYPQHFLGDLFFPLLARTAPIVCVGVVAMKVLHQWLDKYAARSRTELEAAAEQRREFAGAMERRVEDIARREDALKAAEATTEARFRELHRVLEDQRRQITTLTAERDELQGDYNRVVSDALQQSAELFRPRATGDQHDTAPCIPLPTRARGPAPHPVRGAADPSLLP